MSHLFIKQTFIKSNFNKSIISVSASEVNFYGSCYDDEMIKRYIASVYDPQAKTAGIESIKYKLVRSESLCYIVSSDIILQNDNPYSLTALSAMGDYSVRLRYSSKEEITEDEENVFLEMVKSISMEDKEHTQYDDSEWFSVSDIDSYAVECGKLKIRMPAKYLYYDKTNKNDLCLLARGYLISGLDQLLSQAGNGSDIYFSTYDEGNRILVKTQYVDDIANFDVLNYWDYQRQFAEMFRSSGDSIGLSLLDTGSLISEGTDNPDAILSTMYHIYWVKVKLKNNVYDIEQLMCTTVVRNIQYTITLEKKTISETDEMELDLIISGILKDMK